MEDIKTFELNGHTMEFIPEIHKYVVDGQLVPCVSDILAYRFNDYVGQKLFVECFGYNKSFEK